MIYYVSSNKGCDKNDGLSQNTPFRTLKKLAKQKIYAGDEIRLECSSVFDGESLHLYNVKGEKGKKVLVSSYGDGNKPVISADGSGIWYQNYRTGLDAPTHLWHGYVSSAVLLYDCEYITIENIEITNCPEILGEKYSQADKMNKTGVAVVAQNSGTLHDIEIRNLYIHDIKGNVYDKHLNNGGIYCTVLKPENEQIARYDGLHIHHCVVENCSRWGIAAGYSYTHPFFTTLLLPDEIVKKYGHENVIIEYNYVKSIGSDGITPMYCYKPLIQYNVAEDNANEINDQIYTLAGERIGKTAAAIWPWKCKDALLQYNEAYNTCDNQDGQAWDADSGDGTIYQYNYSYNNQGGCVMFCEPESVNNTFRYNISYMDKGGILNPANNPDANIHNNMFIMPQDVPWIRHNMSGGHFYVENNIIYRLGDKKEGEWYHQTEFAKYNSNLYINFADVPTDDKNAEIMEKSDLILKHMDLMPTSTDGTPHNLKKLFELFASETAKKTVKEQ